MQLANVTAAQLVQPRKRWLPRPNFSLRTLVLFTLAAGSFVPIYVRGVQPWRLVLRVSCPHDYKHPVIAANSALSTDTASLFSLSMNKVGRLYDTRTGIERWKVDLSFLTYKPGIRFLNDDRYIALLLREPIILDTATGAQVPNEPLLPQLEKITVDKSLSDSNGYATAPDQSRYIKPLYDFDKSQNMGWHLYSSDGADLGFFASHHRAPRGVAFSADSQIFVTAAWNIDVRASADGRSLAVIIPPIPYTRGQLAALSPDAQWLWVTRVDDVLLYKHVRPEAWWGLAWLPEFWLAALCSAGLVLSLIRGRNLSRPAVPRTGWTNRSAQSAQD